MAERLRDAVSPYLAAHADNPVDWWPWGEEAFAEAARRDVPVLVSIGYATCHWCHVMARESFSDPALARELNARFVPIKVDREEHPDVDDAFIAAASAFTQQLGWPLTAFATAGARVFYAGTYYPPQPVRDVPSFRQILDAVTEAWTRRRDEVEATGAAIAQALAARPEPDARALPSETDLAEAVAAIAALEDARHGGLGTGPKFPNAPVIAFLAERGRHGDAAADALGRRLHAAAQALRDPVEGGFFRYAVRRDWTEPHYERMLSDNAQMLDLAVGFGDVDAADAVAGFLLDVLRRPDGSFASAQDSESLVDGRRSEGGYYALDAAGRARQPRPAVDAKVLTGLNGIAVGALSDAGLRFGRADWVRAAREAAGTVIETLVDRAPEGLRLRRARRDGRTSDAVATLEDYGGLAGGLLRLALASGDAEYAVLARELVMACAAGDDVLPPGRADPVLARSGIRRAEGGSDGASPSGTVLVADAAALLAALTGDAGHERIAESALRPVLPAALPAPIAYGAALAVASRVAAGPAEQLVIVVPDGQDASVSPLAARARERAAPGRTLSILAETQARRFADAGFALFAERTPIGGDPAAYLCEGFACRLPTTDPGVLDALLRGRR
ncbi:DUF255 domain-containing protein [Microbacterium betulae]|uniref:DUF255 domain-containing protein n=1 Tax=Microbacterium betulae TaxID=2981139 RepID=A0AA97I7D4_9MICO|nr:DUF255 domain-containing protein [Microbacterium sp. AB]WOF24132.1 DUF255 domain-containing protein [Microbacterium sp. AB]